MVPGDCLFSATGVTDGAILRGVKFRKNIIETETVVMRSARPGIFAGIGGRTCVGTRLDVAPLECLRALE